jgi:hypothetical protein
MRAQLIELTPDRASPSRKGVMIEHRLHEGLAVVEVAFHRNRVDVVGPDRRHLAPLDRAHPPLRIENEHVDAIETAERLDRGAARVAGGGADDGGASAGPGQHVVHHAA